MPKTIRELADELGVSKQAIWQKIKRDASIDLRQFTSTKGNTVYVDVDGQKAIKAMFSNDSSTRYRQQKDDVDDNKKDAVDGQDEVKFLRNLVSEIQSEKKELHKLLDQQQRLALQDKQLLEEYKAEIKDLKALTMAPHDDGEKEVTSDKQPEPENSTPESQPKPKKWWRFGK
ncbi:MULTISPECIES: helix-turn-helix domain-containing protein [Lactobacillaceae]|uniref:HTH domain-containing protein n=1 Tax=Levilactobacillus brevis TaxID=1580 RepID=A0A2A3TTV4_LEVBR|nr:MULTISPECIES: HTH domain-containing protein [Lactobacillaceae]KAF0468331.1 HTH domain-containing protein [Pediococcus acidilactici]KHO12900.1 repb-like plasmid replication initiation protein [Latilactobacillus curvatus]MBP5818391.1 HTH domain-containing protein [Lactiplantibacillus plantarum]MDG2982079.1 helix-turn-helix domain-containing protein [Latilactobacillus curvatus]MDY8146751.1 HTH domain-containing protein [Lactiplantibacillus plantarum]